MEWYKELYTKDYIDLCGFASAGQTKREAAFIVETLGLTGGKQYLDICCGFGRHARAVAEITACEITGLDLSDDYLEIARKENAAPNITYIKGDMRNVGMENRFDAVSNLFTSFGFFETDEENEKVIQSAGRSLKPDGLFLLDIKNRFNFVLNDVLKKEQFRKKIDKDKQRLIENRYDLEREREMFSVTIIEEGKPDRQAGYSIRLYSLPELKGMFSRSGIAYVDCWGDFDRSAYSIHSRRLIVLGKKMRS